VTVSSVPSVGLAPTKLGSFTIFDFTRQKLGRSTVLHLRLRISLACTFRSPVRCIRKTSAASYRARGFEPASVSDGGAEFAGGAAGHASVVEFTLPANVPVDRIAFVPAAQPASFSRGVTVRVVDLQAHPRPTLNRLNREFSAEICCGCIDRKRVIVSTRSGWRSTFPWNPRSLPSGR